MEFEEVVPETEDANTAVKRERGDSIEEIDACDPLEGISEPIDRHLEVSVEINEVSVKEEAVNENESSINNETFNACEQSAISKERRKRGRKAIAVQCKYCEMQFKSKTLCREHATLFHGSESFYHCPTCGNQYNDKKSITRHAKSCMSQNETASESDYKCGICESKYKNKYDLNVHIKSKHWNENKVSTGHYTCEICLAILKGSTRLAYHMARKHGIQNDAMKFKCYRCNLAFLNRESRNVHFRRTHIDTKNEYEEELNSKDLPLDGSEIETMQNMTHSIDSPSQHTQDNSATEETYRNTKSKKLFQCEKCKIIYKNEALLQKHLTVVHNEGHTESFAECEICHKLMLNAYCLSRHVKSQHSGVVYKCTYCENTYSNRSSWVIHIKKHNIKLGLIEQSTVTNPSNELKCPECHEVARATRTRTALYVLKVHMRKHTIKSGS